MHEDMDRWVYVDYRKTNRQIDKRFSRKDVLHGLCAKLMSSSWLIGWSMWQVAL